MPDHSMITGSYDVVPSLLRQAVPEFEDSQSYRSLSEGERALPGVVCWAFGDFVLSLLRAFPGDAIESHQTIAKALGVIETLAGSTETAVRNVVTTELLESLDRDPHQLDRATALLGAHTRECLATVRRR
jgi:hypothetical protein